MQADNDRAQRFRQNIAQISVAKAERDRLIAENPDEYFDPRGEHEHSRRYRENHGRHNVISRFTSAPHRDHPEMQRLMILLLENGYDVEDWVNAVDAVDFLRKHDAIRRKEMEAAGFSEEEIQADMDLMGETLRGIKTRAFYEHLQITSSIGKELADQIMEFDLPVEVDRNLKGDGPYQTIRGDRFLTDADWLTDAFREARARYTGPRKLTFEERMDQEDEMMRRIQERRQTLPAPSFQE